MSVVRKSIKDFVSGMVNLVGATVRGKDPREIADRRINRLEREYYARGFLLVLVNANFNAGVDIIAFSMSEGRPLIEVVESTNWKLSRRSGFMQDEKFNRYVNSLNAFNVLSPLFAVRKKLVISYLKNLRRTKLSNTEEKDEVINVRLKTCEENNIDVVVVGYQD